jgi:hypothetical protein
VFGVLALSAAVSLLGITGARTASVAGRVDALPVVSPVRVLPPPLVPPIAQNISATAKQMTTMGTITA